MATVLLVEDEIDLCNLIKGHLEGEGYTVVQSFDGPTALILVEQHHPDLIILDWMLPGMDGLAVCRRVRQSHLMPILMLTARSEEMPTPVSTTSIATWPSSNWLRPMETMPPAGV